MFHPFEVRNAKMWFRSEGPRRGPDRRMKLRTLSAGALACGVAAMPLLLGATAGLAHAAPQTRYKPALRQGPDFTAISFATAGTGWVAGPGWVWHTGDGGRTWEAQYAGRVQIQGLQAVNPRVVYAWSSTTLLASENGGASWKVSYRAQGTILDVSAVSPLVAYVATLSGLHVTRNGGASWVEVPTRTPLAQVAFTSPSQGWGLTRTGRVVRTENGGRTWSVSFALRDWQPGTGDGGVDVGDRLAASSAIDAWVLYSGGSGMNQTSYAVYHTSDGGKNWRAAVAVPTAGAGPAPGNPVHAPSGPEIPGGMGSSPGPLAVLPGGTAYLVGECRACVDPTVDITKTVNGGVTWTQPLLLTGTNGLPTLSDLSFPTAETGWMAVPRSYDSRGTILVTHDGGQRWKAVWPPQAFPPVVAQSLQDILATGTELPVGGPTFLPPEPPSRLYLTGQTAVSPASWTVHVLTATAPYAVNNPALVSTKAHTQTVASFGVGKLTQKVPTVGSAALPTYLWQASLTASGLGKDALGPLLPVGAISRPADLGLGIRGALLTTGSGVHSLVWHEGDWTLVVRNVSNQTALSIGRRVVTYLHKAYMPPYPGLVAIGMGVHGIYTRIDWVDGGYLYRIDDDLGWGVNPVAACEMAVRWTDI